MLKLGIIGTSWISKTFIDGAISTKKYELRGVFSRALSKGQTLIGSYPGGTAFDDFSQFLEADLDLVYIASPNSLHFEQARAVLQANKHVIVEKPAFSNPGEFEEIMNLASQMDKCVFEAARNIHEAAFKTIKDFLSDQKIIGADLTYAKYSSKMPALLAGELPNKWNPRFSGGILADLGVYCLYLAIGLLGKPVSASYKASLLSSGVDVSGVGILHYDSFDLVMKCGGNYTSTLPSEIYTEEGTLILDAVTGMRSVKFISLDGLETELPFQVSENSLLEEAADFARVLEDMETGLTDYLTWQKLAREVSQVSYQMRESAGINFRADKR